MEDSEIQSIDSSHLDVNKVKDIYTSIIKNLMKPITKLDNCSEHPGYNKFNYKYSSRKYNKSNKPDYVLNTFDMHFGNDFSTTLKKKRHFVIKKKYNIEGKYHG